MGEMTEKEQLIQVTQKLDDSVNNQKLMLSEIKSIFDKLEDNSKSISKLEGELRIHIETSKIMNSEIDKDIKNLKSDGKERNQSINIEIKEREKMEERFKAKDKVLKIVLSLLTTFGTLAGFFALIMQFID